ncbi:NADH-quinone oxidoreductase subunit G [Phycicoccus endophyticus]|uniref:NADH-quinone oxidoreductase n=1 Tax=Phycicoccus endophyticus TaxID=1690220 RepID=A0A7G9QZH3_9MICO|nr:NADH-quinone oxidoreductase subunit G [Phycicoccus endophyticus]NHI19111.1 NADH-quinone oxidoreductase subunit G [Phycicoccus endophyticus]QNN48748.1 NADH-quinone oxidoreductase subunit G [Phycicoccus endophyticus]
MTATPEIQAPVELVTLTIDDVEVSVPKGTLIIRAAEQAGIDIPRFCDHPGLDPVGACRQCLVEVWMPGRPGPDGTPGEPTQMQGPPGRMKPQASCTMTVAPGMVVKTQYTSEGAAKAQKGVMELLLINHPLDCPVCDKGGECPLQNQALSNGRGGSRFEDVKRTYPKPVKISSQVLLDRERCVLCARCTRFSEQVAGDPFIALVERGALQQVGIYEEKPFESYFSGNTVQICPVGALTGAAYRFRSRPFDLVSTPSVCEHCASGCSQRTDHRRGTVLRRMAQADPAVNEEWNCDKGRWAFAYTQVGDRLELPMVRDDDGELRVASWPEALSRAAAGLRSSAAGVLVGGRVSAEDAYAYGKFARTVLGTNDVDFRARPHSAEEADFLASSVVGTGPQGGGVTYADLQGASSVLLVGLEPEDESPIVFLRLRKAYRRSKTRVFAVSPVATRGLAKMGGTLIPTAPGTEPEILAALGSGSGSEVVTEAAQALRDGGVILVGERLAMVPGALSAALALAESTGARLAWVPRRAGERGALEAGALPTLLPGGRPAADPQARAEVAAAWQVDSLPTTPGRDTAGMLAAAASGELGALVVAGVDPADLGIEDAMAALAAPFVVSFEIRRSAVTEVADVVLPVAAHAEKGGSFLDWEGRVRPFEAALETSYVSDYRAVEMLADEMGVFLGTRTLREVRAEMQQLGPWSGARAAAPSAEPGDVPELTEGTLVLATWRHLLDRGSLQDGEPFLAGTAPAPVARLSGPTASALGVADGDLLTVRAAQTTVTAPVLVSEMADHVVWLPTNSQGCDLRATLAGAPGALVTVTKEGAA